MSTAELFQDLQSFFGGRHTGGLHPALLGYDRARLADGSLVVHDEEVHGGNFTADSGFFAHDWNPTVSGFPFVLAD
jgi:hypothetical protein